MRIIKRILLGLLLALALLVPFLAASIAVDRLFAPGRLRLVANTAIPNGAGGEMHAFVARPAGAAGPLPAVILIHEFWGLNPNIAGLAQRLADEGYVVVAPNLFRDSATTWIPRAIYQVVATPPEQINADLDAAYAWLAAQPGVDPQRVAVLGFCFGGRAALAYSLGNSRLAGTVVFYGQPVADAAQLRTLPGPVLGIFGDADASIPVADVDAFEAGLAEAGVLHRVTLYPGQPHAFVSLEAIDQGGPAAQAWQEALEFLAQTLQAPASARPGAAPPASAGAPDWGYLLRLAYAHAFGGGAGHH